MDSDLNLYDVLFIDTDEILNIDSESDGEERVNSISEEQIPVVSKTTDSNKSMKDFNKSMSSVTIRGHCIPLWMGLSQFARLQRMRILGQSSV